MKREDIKIGMVVNNTTNNCPTCPRVVTRITEDRAEAGGYRVHYIIYKTLDDAKKHLHGSESQDAIDMLEPWPEQLVARAKVPVFNLLDDQ